MKQEMTLRDLLASNKGLRLNGEEVKYVPRSSLNASNSFAFVRIGADPVSFPIDQTVEFSDNRRAEISVFGLGQVPTKATLQFDVCANAMELCYTFSADGRITAPSLAWREMLKAVDIRPDEFDRLLRRFYKLYAESPFGDLPAMRKTLIGPDMTTADFAAGLQLLAVRYLYERLPIHVPREEEHFETTLSAALLSADTIKLDSASARFFQHPTGRLSVVVSERWGGTARVYDFEANQVVSVLSGAVFLTDSEGKPHNLVLLRHRTVNQKEVSDVVAALSTSKTP